jgi:trans-aconitate 2-methyltransferase
VRYSDFTTITRSHTAPPTRDEADSTRARAAAREDRRGPPPGAAARRRACTISAMKRESAIRTNCRSTPIQRTNRGAFVADTWDPTQYDKFQREREQPFFDLLALVRPAPGMRRVDLGCGTGRLTRALARTASRARERPVSIDRRGCWSKAARHRHPALPTRKARSKTFRAPAERFDLIFSNAAYHWIEDHPALLARLAGALTPSGQLAFRCPRMHDQPSHRIAEDLTAWSLSRRLNGWHRLSRSSSRTKYASCSTPGVHGAGCRLHIYPHVLAGPEEVVEWMKGTLLTEYERHLPGDLYGPSSKRTALACCNILVAPGLSFSRFDGYCVGDERQGLGTWD